MIILMSNLWYNALIILCLGFCTVLLVLIVLIYVLKGFGKIFTEKAPKIEKVAEVKNNNNSDLALDEVAVATALSLYFAEVHDTENLVITLADRKSAWNSKMYGMNNLVK